MKRKSSELYDQLKAAYADANLNRITVSLLDLYRSKDHDKLRAIARKISDTVTVDESTISKCFSQLVMLYHPDKGESHRKELDTLGASGDDAALRRFSHILLLGEMDRPSSPPTARLDTEFTPEYAWGTAEDLFSNTREPDEESFDDAQFVPRDDEYDHSFYQAVKIRVYGTLTIEMPYYYLQDFEEVEMSDCAIQSLDGIEHCIHAKVIDISCNAIADISDLQSLSRVEELYASRNQIGYIDALSSLLQLRIVDLSLNDIDDVSPLFGLEHLELVNIVGNPVPPEQIRKLKSMKCTVIR
jgi:hypothetical protein